MKDATSAANEALGGYEKKPAKKIEKIEHKKSHNGDHIFTHKHTHPEHHADEVHTKRGDDEMVAHMLQYAGTPNPGEEASEQGSGAGVEGANPQMQAAALGTPGA